MVEKTNPVMIFLAIILITHMAHCSDELQSAIPASEILMKINNSEPVEYDHVLIKGDLDISAIGLLKDSKSIASTISISNSTIDGVINFNDIKFLNM